MMGSNHDAVEIVLDRGRRGHAQRTTASPSLKVLKPGRISQYLSLNTEMTCEWLQQVSEQITKTRRKRAGFQESMSLKELRARAQREAEPRHATALWKEGV